MLNFNEKTIHKNKNYNELVKTCQSCTSCKLSNTRTNVVVGHGPVPCELMIVGEGPGEKEDKEGKPFVGRAGQLLTKILTSVGIDREKDVYITNTVKCRPPKNRNPHKEEIDTCKSYLIRQIQLIKPKVLLCLGSPSLKTILEESLAISKVRGNWYTANVNYMNAPLYMMPLFHPSYLLRNQSMEEGKPRWLTWQDIQKVKKVLNFYKE